MLWSKTPVSKGNKKLLVAEKCKLIPESISSSISNAFNKCQILSHSGYKYIFRIIYLYKNTNASVHEKVAQPQLLQKLLN